MEPKMNLVAHMYWSLSKIQIFIFCTDNKHFWETYDLYHLIISLVKPRKSFFFFIKILLSIELLSIVFCKSIKAIPVWRQETRFCWVKSKTWLKLKWDKAILQKVHSLIMNNFFYNLRDKWQQRDGSEVLWISF